ncbi:MAG: hypothetical protein OXU54_02840 [Gammaproteobacteria bacterium]|nr:hypothetical protein [Gammaproteobacteria bacterium]
MPLPPDFPTCPYEILAPDARWSPDNGNRFWDKLPPLVEKLHVAVKEWRDGGYREVSRTTAALLDWWFGWRVCRRTRFTTRSAITSPSRKRDIFGNDTMRIGGVKI